MNNKFTAFSLNAQFIHQLPAGMLIGDFSTELFGCRESKEVFAISNGTTIPFEKIGSFKMNQILKRLAKDKVASKDLSHLSNEQAAKKYSFCVFGGADSNPDFCKSGELKESDNFLCSNNCKCLKWESKNITINGNSLTPRQIEIVQLLASDFADKQIADKLNITTSTLDSHKSKIFELADVCSKNGLIIKAIEEKIVQ
jgi:DNA-binding CsgD family transcriptional regulator